MYIFDVESMPKYYYPYTVSALLLDSPWLLDQSADPV